jgi:hypothetical protein
VRGVARPGKALSWDLVVTGIAVNADSQLELGHLLDQS